MANSVTVVTASIVFIVSIIGLWSKVKYIDLPKSIVIECDFILPSYNLLFSVHLKFSYCIISLKLLTNKHSVAICAYVNT